MESQTHRSTHHHNPHEVVYLLERQKCEIHSQTYGCSYVAKIHFFMCFQKSVSYPKESVLLPLFFYNVQKLFYVLKTKVVLP